MTQKTIKFNLSGGYNPYYPGDDVKVGDEYILVKIVETKQDDYTHWGLLEHDGHGVPGNSNPDITRYHGWRGTSYGTALYAYGLRKVTAVTTGKDKSGDEWIKITVGKDILPDEP